MNVRRSNFLPFRLEPLAFFLLGLLVRIAFIHLHPAIYGGDTLARIMHADRVLLAYQLPLLQLLIYLVNLVSTDPWLIRCLMSLIGALAGAAFYLLSSDLLDRPAARFATLFFVFNPFLLVHSIVPYQEILMLLTLCLGLYFLLRPDFRGNAPGCASTPRSTASNVPPEANVDLGGSGRALSHSVGYASFFLGLACLTRYEAWVITAVTGLHYARLQLNARPDIGYSRLLVRTMLLFGWAPLFWILLQSGLSPAGTYVLEEPASWARLWRIPYVTAMTLYHAGPIVCLLGTGGLLMFWKRSLVKNRSIQMLLAAAALLMLSLVFSAHGVEPDPQRYVTDREAHWFLLFPLWAAALGLGDLRTRLTCWSTLSRDSSSNSSRNLRIIYYAFLILTVLWGTFETNRYVKQLLTDQNLVLDYAVARYLERNLADGAKALIFAKPLPPDASKEYFDKVYSQGGLKALEAARQQLAEINSGSVEFSRIAVNSRVGRNRFLDANKVIVTASDSQGFLSHNHVRLAAVFSNYSSRDVNPLVLLEFVKHQGKHRVTFADRGLQVSIYEAPF